MTTVVACVLCVEGKRSVTRMKGSEFMERSCVQRAVTLSVCNTAVQKGMLYAPAASSARHVHLCERDVERLFGSGYQLKEFKPLAQPGQYACEEKITIKGPKGEIKGVRVLGPTRPDTQVEISVTDSFKLGIKPVVRMSGNTAGSPGATLIGPAGQVDIAEGVIVSARHLHISDEQAANYGLKDGDVISLKKRGEREVTFGNIAVRAGKKHSLEAHFDTDEANAALLKNGELMEIIK